MKNKIFVLIDTIQKVRDFSSISNKLSNNVIVKSGVYTVDGKSLLGLFSLDLSNPVEVILHGDINEDDWKQIEQFVA